MVESFFVYVAAGFGLESLKFSKVQAFASKPILASSESSISEIIGLLKRSDAYEVIVQTNNKLGIITMRDVLRVSDISNMKASSVMSSPARISPNDTVAKAARLMNDYRLRTLPITGQKSIEGAITAQSLCQALLPIKDFGSVAVDKLAKKDLITISKNDPVSKARNLMIEKSIDHLPVMDAGKPCGIIISSQIVFSMFPKERMHRGFFSHERVGYLDFKVSGMMDTNVLYCEPEEKASAVLKRMVAQGKTYALVKLWDELQGIVTYRDFLGILAEPEELEVPAYIVGLPSDPFESQLANIKFVREAKILTKSFPDIEEIRATIKTKEVSSGKRRYEVSVLIKTHGKIRAYSAEGWDLPLVFDGIGNKMKRLREKKPERRGRESVRKAS
jgi:CBS domain-containing protein